MPSPSQALEPQIQMTFPLAITQVLAGKFVTRKDWNNANEYVHFAGGWLAIHHDNDPIAHAYLVCEADLLGTDWVTL